MGPFPLLTLIDLSLHLPAVSLVIKLLSLKLHLGMPLLLHELSRHVVAVLPIKSRFCLFVYLVLGEARQVSVIDFLLFQSKETFGIFEILGIIKHQRATRERVAIGALALAGLETFHCYFHTVVVVFLLLLLVTALS